MAELEQPRSQTARDIIAKLHPAIKEEWRVKLLRVEVEALESFADQIEAERRGEKLGVDGPGPE